MPNSPETIIPGPSFDIKDYIDAATDAAKRTRTVTIVLVVASVMVFIGFWNSAQWSWAHDRLKNAFDPDDPTIYGTLDPASRPKVQPSSLFSAGDFTDLGELARKLANQEDPRSEYLYSQLKPYTQKLLADYIKDGKNSKEFLPVLVIDLNELLKEQHLYDMEQFKQIPHRQETNEFITRNPTGDGELIRLNRLLLEDSYPLEIAKSYATNPAEEFRKQLQEAGVRGYVENV